MAHQAVIQGQPAPVPAQSHDNGERLLRLVSDAAHELVGPVNQVSSLVALFVNRYRGQLDDEAERLLALVEFAGTRIATTADALRSYLSVIRSTYQPARVDSRGALTAAVRELESEIEECSAEVCCGTLPDIQGDANLLSLLFQTLISNSLKFRRPDSRPRIDVSAECSSARCLYTVSDNGIGIDPHYSEAVFTAFTRLHGHAYAGAGIGLTLARAVAETLGGRIWVGNTEGEGTTVFFELPEAASDCSQD